MKLIFFTVSYIMFSFSLLGAQSISGRIIDQTTKLPLEFVNIIVYKDSSQVPLVGVASMQNGFFLIDKIPSGKYKVIFSLIGYAENSKKVSILNQNVNLGEVRLKEDSKFLKDLEVVGQGSQMKFDIDKRVFSVDRNIASSGGSASDVLQNIPSVDVDGEGNVSLRNNSSVEVWINGKPSGLSADNRAQVLQQMPAESIEKIEIMTNPSAKYKAEGTSGIINIVLKENRKAGYNGSVSAGAMYVDKSKPTGTLGLNLNYSSNKVDAYLNLGYRAMDFNGAAYFDRYGLNGSDTTSLLNQVSQNGRGYSGIFGRAGVDYRISDKHTISVSGFGMLGSGYSSSIIDYQNFTYLNNIKQTIPIRDFIRTNNGIGKRPSSSVTLDYRFDIDKLGSNLMSSFSFSPHKRTGNETIVEKENDEEKQNFVQNYEGNKDEYEFKLDYTKIFSTNQKLELGINTMTETRFSPAFAFDNLLQDSIKSYFNTFLQSESNFAGYATYGSKFGNFTYQAGLRAEYFIRNWDNIYYVNENDSLPITIKGDMYKKLNLFPSAYLSYSLPNKNELQLNVTRRIRRPHGREINPFRNYSDANIVSYGNPAVLPELSTAFEINHIKSWENHILSTSVYYRFTDDVMQSVQFLNSRDTMEKTTMNLAKSSNMGLEFVAKNRLLKILNLTSTVNFYYNIINASSYASIYNPSLITYIPEKEMFSWNVKTLANLILGSNTSLQVTGEYSAPRLIAQGEESAIFAVDFGLRQTFMDKKLSLNLMVRDLFNSRRKSTIIYGNGFYQKSEAYSMGRLIGLTATYNFGNMKPKQVHAKKGENGVEDFRIDE